MATQWGNRVGGNQQALGINIEWRWPEHIAWDTAQAVVRVQYFTHQNKYSGDNQTLNRTGSASGIVNFYMPATANHELYLGYQDVVINLNGYGAQTTVTFSGHISGHYGGVTPSASINYTIPARPYPVSSPTMSSTNFTMGSAITINTNRQNSNFTHTIEVLFGSNVITAATGVADSYVYNFPAVTYAPSIPTANSGTAIVRLHTYNGGTWLGNADIGVTLNVPDGNPTVGTITTKETVAAVAAVTGVNINTHTTNFVQNISQVAIGVTGYAPSIGSAIQSVIIAFDGGNYTGPTWTSDVLAKTGNFGVSVTVTDTRGRSASQTLAGGIKLIPWTPPVVTNISIYRTDSGGNAQQPLGTYAKVILAATVSSIKPSDTELNRVSYTIKARPKGGSYTTVHATTNSSEMSVVHNSAYSGYPIANAYDFEISVVDKFAPTTIYGGLPTGTVTMCWNKNGVGIGKVWQSGALDVFGDVNIEGNVNITVPSGGTRDAALRINTVAVGAPVGSVTNFAGETAPEGWLLCQGQAVSRTTYEALFAVTGTSYGAGNGTTTFNVPNLQGKVAVGLDITQSEFNPLGKPGGEKTHTLSVDEIPSHTHNSGPGSPNGFFAHAVGPGNWDSGFVNANGEMGWYRQPENTGGGQPHNNLAPYLTMNAIIKY